MPKQQQHESAPMTDDQKLVQLLRDLGIPHKSTHDAFLTGTENPDQVGAVLSSMQIACSTRHSESCLRVSHSTKTKKTMAMCQELMHSRYALLMRYCLLIPALLDACLHPDKTEKPQLGDVRVRFAKIRVNTYTHPLPDLKLFTQSYFRHKHKNQSTDEMHRFIAKEIIKIGQGDRWCDETEQTNFANRLSCYPEAWADFDVLTEIPKLAFAAWSEFSTSAVHIDPAKTPESIMRDILAKDSNKPLLPYENGILEHVRKWQDKKAKVEVWFYDPKQGFRTITCVQENQKGSLPPVGTTPYAGPIRKLSGPAPNFLSLGAFYGLTARKKSEYTTPPSFEFKVHPQALTHITFLEQGSNENLTSEGWGSADDNLTLPSPERPRYFGGQKAENLMRGGRRR